MMVEYLVIFEGEEGAYGGFKSMDDAEEFIAAVELESGFTRRAEKIIRYEREDWD